MFRVRLALRAAAVLGLLAPVACTAASPGSSGDQMEIPSDYPQLSRLEFGRAELVVDGTPYDADDGIGSFDGSGIDDTRLRLDLDFDSVLHIDVLDLAVGEYTVDEGDVEARWQEVVGGPVLRADASCGGGTIKVVGSEPRESLPTAQYVLWGTIALELCGVATTMEVSGRFSVLVVEL